MATETVLETLEAARKLISDPAKWTQGELAVALGGEETEPWYPEACMWCSAGALLAVCGGWGSGLYTPALYALDDVMGTSVGGFNDTHTHAEVLAAFDAAIAKEKEAQHVI